MEILKKSVGVLKHLTHAALAILALAVVLQVLFGPSVAFFPVDVVGNVLAITKSLGSEGLVGLVALGVLIALFKGQE